MELSELKLVSASNIIKLRTGAGLTQAELGAKLNYSDKTISKWERGEAIPDAYVLTQLARIFDVTVDYLLSAHDESEMTQEEDTAAEEPAGEAVETLEDERRYSANIIMVLTVLSIWTLALVAFVVVWLVTGGIYWRMFAIALPVSLLVLLILMCVFKKERQLQYAIAAFVFSLFVSVYLLMPDTNPWQVFLISVPAVAIVFLACNIHRRPRRQKKNADQQHSTEGRALRRVERDRSIDL